MKTHDATKAGPVILLSIFGRAKQSHVEILLFELTSSLQRVTTGHKEETRQEGLITDGT
ncbi:MAG: hypothetical protein NWQ42_07440 [Alishewanella sp.]|nr:hypothetical protein [Alishewanella sp.]MDP5186722.1 hypothetical protein [Alishewanella sp.]